MCNIYRCLVLCSSIDALGILFGRFQAWFQIPRRPCSDQLSQGSHFLQMALLHKHISTTFRSSCKCKRGALQNGSTVTASTASLHDPPVRGTHGIQGRHQMIVHLPEMVLFCANHSAGGTTLDCAKLHSLQDSSKFGSERLPWSSISRTITMFGELR